MSDIIVLDYSDGVVHIYHNEDGGGDIEDFLFSREGFKESETEWMSAPKLTFHHHENSTREAIFRIDKDEIGAFTDKDISPAEMKKILSYIENDEGVWEAIEVAKRDAIASVLR